MRIGVDIDDTISFTHKKLIEAALEYDENYVNGKGFKNKNPLNCSGTISIG